MKNINDLRTELIDCFDAVKKDPRRANQVKEQVNAAGKILASLKAEMEYSYLRGDEPDIPFMGPTSGKKLSPMARMISG